MDQRLQLDPVEIILARLRTLAVLLSAEEVAAAFARLDVTEQVTMFGLFESLAADLATAVARDAEMPA